MSKWRPSKECIYVIPDIHGRADELNAILKRILPLRNNKNGKDRIVFLGDYVDRGPKSPEVIEILIDLKTQYDDQIILLKGNHDDLMLRACRYAPGWKDISRPSPYTTWLRNGGADTIQSYAERSGLDKVNPYALSQDRNISFVNSHHLTFLRDNMVDYHETDRHIFIHGGFNPQIELSQQEVETMIWDRSLFNFIQDTEVDVALPWDKTIVCGHSYVGPVLRDKYMMIDSSKQKRLMVAELNSNEIFFVCFGNTKMTKWEQ